jgi:hypothetical protein
LRAAVVLFAILGASCASASAKPGYVTFQGERKSQFEIKGTQGFQITVERTGHRVELVASNGNSAAIYIVHSPATRDADIHARFPGVGVVSTHFEPSGSTSRTPAICGGGPSIRRDGVFRGTIKIRGERGSPGLRSTVRTVSSSASRRKTARAKDTPVKARDPSTR